jgi:hypothetical protein
MSLRDIGIILKKDQVNHGITAATMDKGNNSNSNNNNRPANEKATQAYKLFSEGKSLIEVSIELGLREKEATKLFREFLKLKQKDRLHQIYPEIEPSLSSFLKLHKVLKKRGLNLQNTESFVDIIESGVIKLPNSKINTKNFKTKSKVFDIISRICNTESRD